MPYYILFLIRIQSCYLLVLFSCWTINLNVGNIKNHHCMYICCLPVNLLSKCHSCVFHYQIRMHTCIRGLSSSYINYNLILLFPSLSLIFLDKWPCLQTLHLYDSTNNPIPLIRQQYHRECWTKDLECFNAVPQSPCYDWLHYFPLGSGGAIFSHLSLVVLE